MSDYPYVLLPFKHGSAHQVILPRNDQGTTPFVARYGEYSEIEVDVFRKFVKPGSLVVDAGALFGLHTLALAELVGDRGRVLAFEPQEIPRNIAVTNLRLNDCHVSEIVDCALWDCSTYGCVETGESALETRGWGLSRVSARPTCPTSPWCDCVRLDNWLKYADFRIDSFNIRDLFIKLDVEGSEVQALNGAAGLFESNPPVVYVEFQENQDRIVETLQGFGYQSMWAHNVPEARTSNYLNQPLMYPCYGPTMLLTVPEHRKNEVEPEWLDHLKFWAVEISQ